MPVRRHIDIGCVRPREGHLSLLVGNDGDIVGREPPALFSKQTVPPARGLLRQDLNDVAAPKRKGRGILGIVVIEGAAEKSRKVVHGLLLGVLRLGRGAACSRGQIRDLLSAIHRDRLVANRQVLACLSEK